MTMIILMCNAFFSLLVEKNTVDGFFMQGYNLNANGSLTASGSGSFRVGYAPDETGTWSYVLSCTNTSGTTNLAHGIYYLSVHKDNGNEIGYEKIVK